MRILLTSSPQTSRIGHSPALGRVSGRVAARLDALDTSGCGVSTAQHIDIYTRIGVCGRFGRFGRPRARLVSRARDMMSADVSIRARACPIRPIRPIINKDVYISVGYAVDGGAFWVSKASTGIKYARKCGTGNGGCGPVGRETAKSGVCGACGGFFGADTATGARAFGQNQGLGGRIRGDVAGREVAEMRKCKPDQQLSPRRPLVQRTSACRMGGHFGGSHPPITEGGTPKNAPPRPFVACFAVIAAPVRGAGQARQSGSQGPGARGLGAMGRGPAAGQGGAHG